MAGSEGVQENLMISEVPSELQKIGTPCVLKSALKDWDLAKLSLDDWEACLSEKELRFKVGLRQEYSGSVKPEWDPECAFVHGTFAQFRRWVEEEVPLTDSSVSSQDSEGNEFEVLDSHRTWAYFDYKHLSEVFEGEDDRLVSVKKMVNWEPLGFPDRGVENTTLWVGTKGAHTPGHYDTYGYNIVGQLLGRKLWILFRPEDGLKYLKPTRVPFEESSVFSRLRVSPMRGVDLALLLRKDPDYRRLVEVGIKPYVVILNPGDALYVPSGWWHFVSCCSDETAISVNTWVEIEADHHARLKESVTKSLTYVLAQKFCTSVAENEDEINSLDSIVFDSELNLMDSNLKDNLDFLKVAMERLELEKASKSSETSEKEVGDTSLPKKFRKDETSLAVRRLSPMNWGDLVTMMKEHFPAVEGGAPLYTVESNMNPSEAGNERLDCFLKLLQAVTHPTAISSICEALLDS